MLIRNYNGWSICDNGKDYHPKTGRFMATRFGVRVGSSTQESVIAIIDHHDDTYTPNPRPSKAEREKW